MTSRECVITALGNGRPEWIPTFEWLVDHRVRRALCPDGDELDFVEWAGWDAVVVYADDHPDNDGKSSYIDEWGLKVQRCTEEYPVITGPRFGTRDDLRSLSPPDPAAEWHFRSLRRAFRRFGGDKAIIFRLRDAYSLPRYLLGLENLMVLMVTEPEFVRQVIDLSVDYYVRMARVASALGADVFWTSDDYCDNRGPIMGPALWRSFVLPGLKCIVHEVKELGKPFIKHCDGNVTMIVNDLIDAGIDCIDPIDAEAGLCLGEIKSRYGHRVAIKGGLPVQRLCHASPADIHEAVQACIRAAGPQGYILSSSSDITASVRAENYAAMLDAWRTLR